jgi:hypothetical protein
MPDVNPMTWYIYTRSIFVVARDISHMRVFQIVTSLQMSDSENVNIMDVDAFVVETVGY